MNYEKNPTAIEDKSMEIIENLMKNSQHFSEEERSVIKRMIHTTADFEFEDLIRFYDNPIHKMKTYIGEGCKIYTDTQMIQSGINRHNLNKHGCQLVNYVHDTEVAEKAISQKITRSMAALEKAFDDEVIKIFARGNAPTALFRLLELLEKQPKREIVIMGVPVGFIGAEESKEALAQQTSWPYITIYGRKGGSTVAAAIVNAVLKMMTC